MNIERRNLADLHPAAYNPRRELKPGEPEYEKIARSIEQFGYVDPLVVNKDGTVIGGHQRLRVLQDMGATEADVVVLDLDKDREKALNIALNKITGDWDPVKLTEVIGELDLEDYDLSLTGYSEKELEAILAEVRLDPDNLTDEFELPDREHVTEHTMNVTMHKDQIAIVEAAIDLAMAEGDVVTFGNENRNGNGLYKVVSEWLENLESEQSDDD